MQVDSIVEVMEAITEIKTYLKTLPGSNFLVNRRSPTKKEFISAKSELVSKKKGEQEKMFVYRPLGQILVDSQIITHQQLERALSKHWSTGQKIGQSVVGLGMASAGDIARALETQLNVPHFDIRKLGHDVALKKAMDKIPIELIKDRGIIPVKKENNVLSLAMLNPKDMKAIEEVKGFTGCSVAPFFVLEGEFSEILEKMIKKADKGL